MWARGTAIGGMKIKETQVKDIPISAIEVLNPRQRDKRVFREIVDSIARLGLKRPIVVSARGDVHHYQLVYGEGRIKAFAELGEASIPALLIDVSTEDCLLMGLVENLTRCHPSSVELVSEIGRLAKQYTAKEIATKLDFSPEYIRSICYLLKHGEERLLDEVEKKYMPHSIAISSGQRL
jgi:ParB family chromosome partitioning protein